MCLGVRGGLPLRVTAVKGALNDAAWRMRGARLTVNAWRIDGAGTLDLAVKLAFGGLGVLSALLCPTFEVRIVVAVTRHGRVFRPSKLAFRDSVCSSIGNSDSPLGLGAERAISEVG